MEEFKQGARVRIAKSLGVRTAQVVITNVSEGSVKVGFTVADLTPDMKERILSSDVTGKLRQQFSTFKEMQISPAVLALHFDLDSLDDKGHKDFSTGSTTFQVGPPAKKRTYHQPSGWTRYGLKVLGKYDSDTWLHPFGDPGNWYRAFHGTGRAGDSTASRQAAHSIVDTGFEPSKSGKIGPGVYVSPFIDYVQGYGGKVHVDTTNGCKQFLFALQVAVEPGSIMREDYPRGGGDNQEWTAPPNSVRPYGLLIKDTQAGECAIA